MSGGKEDPRMAGDDVVYYRGPEAMVTGRRLVRRDGSGAVFQIADLSHLQKVTVGRRGYGWVCWLIFAAFLSVVTTWPRLRVLLIAGLAAAAIIGVLLLVNPEDRQWRLLARYRDDDAVIFATNDPRTFRLVVRALRRAMASPAD
jgi:hypothetical protein